MTRKLDFIPPIPGYQFIREQMVADLAYRLESRTIKTNLGRPLYYRINVQVVMTQECPYTCPFCIERQNPMTGNNDFKAQLTALRHVLTEHPNARLTITGGEPGLYPEHVRNLVDVFKQHSNNVFAVVNTAGYSKELNNICRINLSVNPYVKSDPLAFPGCTYQTVLEDSKMRLERIVETIVQNPLVKNFSFRFLSGLNQHDYDTTIFNELRESKFVKIHTFRIGDFFTYVTFDTFGAHCRVTLGDMYQQTHNDYQDGYSNIVIHPDGRIGVNWK